MSSRQKKYVGRMISENEDALLDEIWDSIHVEDGEADIVGETEAKGAAVETEVIRAARGGAETIGGGDVVGATEVAEETDIMFDQLVSRIKSRRRSRKRLIYASAGVAAMLSVAVVTAVALLTQRDRTSDIEKLVTFANAQVELVVGDGPVVYVDKSASVVVDGPGEIPVLRTNDSEVELRPEQNVKITVPEGQQFDIQLADGTHMWLNGGTTIEYPSTFAGADKRVVKMTGEAFFEVAHDPAKPFEVEVEGGETVRVLGTVFNVTAYEGDDQNVATLLSGSIQYRNAAGRTTLLEPDQRVRSIKRDGSLVSEEVYAADAGMWKDGLVCMDGCTLSEIARRLSRMYGVGIEVADRVAGTSFSGAVAKERGLGHIVKLFTETSDIKFRIENGIIYLE